MFHKEYKKINSRSSTFSDIILDRRNTSHNAITKHQTPQNHAFRCFMSVQLLKLERSAKGHHDPPNNFFNVFVIYTRKYNMLPYKTTYLQKSTLYLYHIHLKRKLFHFESVYKLFLIFIQFMGSKCNRILLKTI